MGRIRRWLRGTFKVDRVESESLYTGNVSLDSVTGDGLPAHAIEHGKAWADNGQLYDTVQSAVDNASDTVLVGPGIFAENVDISTTITLTGSGVGTVIDGGTSDAAISITSGTDITVKSLAAKTTAGQGNGHDGIIITADGGATIHDVWILAADRRAITLGSASAGGDKVTDIICKSSNIDSSTDILLDSDNSLVDDIRGTVNDQSTGSTVGETV